MLLAAQREPLADAVELVEHLVLRAFVGDDFGLVPAGADPIRAPLLLIFAALDAGAVLLKYVAKSGPMDASITRSAYQRSSLSQ